VSRANRLVVRFDGGSRGNPGPAAAAAVVELPDGEVLKEVTKRLGEATNNVAEYHALLLGLALARSLGAEEVEIVGDSQLVLRQLTGAYKVRNAGLAPLHRQALEALDGFKRWEVREVPRKENRRADRLVNKALDGKASDALSP